MSRQPIDATIEIVTPENIAFQYRVAGPFRRFPAFLIDLAIRIAIAFALMQVLGLLGLIVGGLATAAFVIAIFLLEWLYGGLFEAYMNGMTPGKWMLGIRVLRTDGQPINGLQAVMRNLLRTVDMFPPLSLEVFGLMPAYMLPTFMVGLVVMTMNRRFQRLGDLVCGTMVVIEERQWSAGLAKLEDPRVYQLAAYLPADFRPSRTLAQALAHYVERRTYFSPPRRREVARFLAEPLLEDWGLPTDTSYDLLLCSLYYRVFIADRAQDEEHVAAAIATGDPFLPRPAARAASPPPVADDGLVYVTPETPAGEGDSA